MRLPLRLLFVFALALACRAGLAAYPDKPIRIIVTSAAGSPLDAMARMVGKLLGPELKVPIVIENKVGGTGAVGMAQAMQLPADGYTLVTATGSTSFLMAEAKSAYSPEDFLFFRGLQAEPSSMAVRADSPYRSMKELVAALKATPEKVSVGGFAAAGFHQYVYYRLQQEAGVQGVWVPFNGGNQAVLALMGGHVQAAGITPSSALPQIQRGELRLLGISSPQRDPNFPDVPTYKEQGFNVVEEIWRGLMVRKGTPPEALATLNAALDRIEAMPEWKTFMADNKQSFMRLSSAQMQKHVETEVKSRRDFLQALGSGGK
ncbi:tripartite tricarboxylate transporter substrate binding protein [Ramlibacter sp. AW1]|uniref:Tripartite tricarboxylate transporter substrate binding protein n=1 Tax=Ramlibacter aurantiacus TaxID=2801330 RepID=A0A937D585_9BURK|nr:tripartite tricarboxylate transporter substrate binding protein [Ramlibacter aurantiacus]MBL0421072.1 tripartite tricarboxylate transporter substrate binding protein [Ramlibacter aurantiacus]